MKLKTKRLIIRPLKAADKNEIFAYRQDRETNQFQGWIPESIHDVQTFIGNTAKQINKQGTWFQFVIINQETQKIMGDIGLHFFDQENKQVEIGCTLGKKYHHNGYAAEALTSTVDYLFGELNKHRIIASCDPQNKAAMRLFERLSFRNEAHHIESLYFEGQWVDNVIFAMLDKDWGK